jgi:hypothetical protein
MDLPCSLMVTVRAMERILLQIRKVRQKQGLRITRDSKMHISSMPAFCTTAVRVMSRDMTASAARIVVADVTPTTTAPDVCPETVMSIGSVAGLPRGCCV